MSLIISIDGNIGSGKSTILKHLRDHLIGNRNYVFVDEPVKECSKIEHDGITILEKFYGNTEKYSFSFQMMAYITRLNMLKTAVKENPNAIIITERCLYTDKFVFAKMLYDQKQINPYEYQIYNKWFDEFISDLPEHKFFFIKSDPIKSKERINKRKRVGEDNISIDYLKSCEKYHLDMYNKHSQNTIKIIDIESYNLESETYNLLINEIISLMDKHLKKYNVISNYLHNFKVNKLAISSMFIILSGLYYSKCQWFNKR
jgi:deoxyadenosine/deoxycytidine kinase